MQNFCRLIAIPCMLLLLLLVSNRSLAQTDITIGNGTTTNTDWVYPCPLPDKDDASRMQFLYLASEMTAAGMTAGNIHAIRFKVTDLGMYVGPDSEVDKLTIKIGTTTNGSLNATTWEPGTVTVFGPANHLPVLGNNSFNFTTPFFWNGTDNIVIEICTDASVLGTRTANPYVAWTTGLPFNGSHTIGEIFNGNLCDADAASYSNKGDQTSRPDIIFNYTTAPPCTSATLTAGTAATSKVQVCSGEDFALSLNGTSFATGLSYQWQSSPDNVNWTNITKGTTASFTHTQTASTWYHAIVTCASGGTATSAPIQVLTPLPLSGTFTIDRTQPAGGGNFKTFNDAYNHIKCGINGAVVFNVAAGSGTYNEQLILHKVPGSSATNTITFNGATGAAIEFQATANKERAVIKLDGADYFVFNNLMVNATGSGSSQYGYGFQLLNDADSNVVNQCIINTKSDVNSNNYAGIVVSGSATSPVNLAAAYCDGNRFIGNTIAGGKFGITLVGAAAVANGNNRISQNNFKDFGVTGIYIACSFNTIVDSNQLSRPLYSESPYELHGIYVTGLNTKLNITKNTITNLFGGGGSANFTYGIRFSSAAAPGGLENVVSNNLLYQLNGGGNVYGLYNSLSHNALYYHNTISLDGDGNGTTAEQVATGFYQADATGLQIFNNNISVTRGGIGDNTAIWFNTPVGDIQSDRNNFFVTSGTGTRQVGYLNGDRKTYLADWAAASGRDAASLSTDPQFVDLATGNLAPANAALNNAGANVGITTDITGAARIVATPDIGAFEFTPPPCTIPPTPGTTVLSHSAVCVDLSVSGTLTGHSTGAAQTYQWQYASTAAGTYQPIGTASTSPEFSFTATTTLYYRVAVACGGNTAYSTPVLLTVYPAFPAGTYTINKNLPASTTNFTSFNAAYSALDCGISGPVVFEVASNSGPYNNEQLIMGAIKGASATNTITFKGNGNTLRFSSDDSEQRAVVKMNGTDHVIIDSLVIDATGTGMYGYGVQLLNNADSNVIRKSVIITNTTSTEDTYAGIVISNSHEDPIATGNTWCDGNLLQGNTITGGYYGITLAGDPVYFSWMSNFINDNKIIGNTITNFYTRGIYVIGTERTLIEGNTITRPTRTGVTAFYGAYFDQTNAALSFVRNRITNPFGGNTASTQSFYGLYFDYAGHELPATIANNIIYNINGSGAQYGIYSNGGRLLHFYHNTILLDNQGVAGSNTAETNGFFITYAGEDVDFRNNIVHITRSGSGLKHGFNVSAGDIIPLRLDRNDYYIKGPGGNNFTGYRNGSRATLAEWQFVTNNRDLHSISADPVFKDIAAGDLSPTIAPLNDKGEPTGTLIDIVRVTRSTTTPDMGAYEFAPTPCISGVLAGTAAANPNTGICIGATITLSLTGNTNSGLQTYRWQRAAAATGPWENISDTLYVSQFKTEAVGSSYYRCVVSCTGINDTSTVTQITLNAAMPGGIYTISNSGAADYPSFTAAVAALQCGIAGPVTFNVAPGTYTEQVYMRRVPGASAINRVTFQSADGNAASVTLTAAGTSTANYVLKLDSASYITYKYLSLVATHATNARVVELAGTSSYDSLSNNIITTVTATATATSRAAVYASPLKGDHNVISGNTINNGASSIYIAGNSINRNNRITIESNTLKGFYQYGVYTSYSSATRINGNSITVAAPKNSTSYGIYNADSDSAYQVKSNSITISNIATTAYGIYVIRGKATLSNGGHIESNKVMAITGIAGNLYGLYVSSATNARIINNVVSINTSGNSSYALYSTSNINAFCYNNTLYSTATSGTNNFVAYFTDGYDDQHYADIRNNILAHAGGGKALYVSNTDRFYSDYNLLYTTGAVLVQNGFTADYATLDEWRTGGDLDLNSIVYEPAIISSANPAPDVNAPGVWAMHGRGIQLSGNDHDIDNKPRPVTLKAGVPDLGAYEFEPAAAPPAAVASPAAPAPGVRQVFTLGTDTVCAITWGAAAPTAITVKRYSGVAPTGLTAGTDYMYFYVDADVTAAGAYDYSIDQHYLDPWRGFIDRESRIRMGKTDNAGVWTVDAASRVDNAANIITQHGLTYADKFTGLADGTVAYPPTDSAKADTSNRGTRFWVGFGHNNNQIDKFVIKMGGADHDANVTVKVNGTAWVRHYQVPAHTYVNSDPVPATGGSGALLLTEGLSERGISIESDEPIAAYVHAEGGISVGAAMLMPVGTYGYEYYALSYQQLNLDINVRSWFYVIADHDSTMVEITPTNPTLGGRAPGVPFVVTLQKGEVYQLMGADKTENENYDLSGSKIRSISNASGKCYPIAVFSGNSRAFIDCAESFVPFGGYLIQQNYPAQSWGTQYLAAPTSRTGETQTALTNFYRILVKDPATVVKVNGTTLTGLAHNYYSYQSDQAIYIDADKPVMVAQYIPGSSNVCDFGDSSPEVFFLPSLDNGIRKTSFYRAESYSSWGTPFTDNYLTLVIPTAGLSSLLIDGSNTWDHSYVHPGKAGYTVVVKRWDPANAVSTVQSDSAFVALTYGTGGGSYGVVAGVAFNSLQARPGITNIYDSSGNYSAFTCIGTPFRYSVLLPVQPISLTWKFSKAANMVPDVDSVQLNPVPVGTALVNGRTYYRYALQKEYVFPATGQFTVPIEYIHPIIGNCTNTSTKDLVVTVVPAPVVDFNIAYTGCLNDMAQFTPQVNASNNDVAAKWRWNFGDNTTAQTEQPSKQYSAAGNYTVKLDIITRAGCIAGTTKPIVVKPAITDPVIKVDLVTAHEVRFSWTAVPTVQAYQVSTDGGTTWTIPSSGTAGLTHTITGLEANKPVSFHVKAIDPLGCKDGIADTTVTTLQDILFIPTAFTPNGDGLNDVFKIETYVQRMHMMIFNQWGEKIFESSDPARGWDGRYKGTLQPSGVYMYVCTVVLADGTKEVKKGSVSLVR